ncbi:MAG: glycosyltransferase family 4 protein [Actinomycetota bacterium]|nr:glycosyltransferase family 4 protein [Actinomycetota bacterium]
MRVALVYQGFALDASLERERVLLARALVEAGVELDYYGDPRRTTVDLAGATFRPVQPLLRSGSRIGHAFEYGSFARAATVALRRERDRYDVIDVAGTTAWEHDVVRVHAVQKAEAGRWPERGGRSFRAARTRAALAPVTRPKVGVARVIERLQFRPGCFNVLLAASEEVRDDLQEVHAVPRELIEVLLPPVETERFGQPDDGAARRALRVGPDDALLLFVGHDFERKGLGEAITALAGLPPRAHLVVVGRGDPRRYARAAHDAGLAERVHFVGATDSPEQWFAAADIFLLPTREDVWGMTVIEAMAAGVPVVVTAVAGAAAQVREAEAGVVVPDASARTLTDVLSRLVSAPAERRRLGERGRDAAARFGVRAFGRAALAAYERALAARRGRRASP